MDLPVLYSFRRCPYAIRARLAIQLSGKRCELREVVLRDKPAEMLMISPKGTVPVLQVSDRVIDESLDIIAWALEEETEFDVSLLAHSLIKENDGSFKQALDRYKYFDRFPEHSQEEYLQQCRPLLDKLESSLQKDEDGNLFVLSQRLGLLDIAIFPFVRQFYFVSPSYFQSLQLPRIAKWLKGLLESDLFASVMGKYPAWKAESSDVIIFPEVENRQAGQI